MNYSVQVLLSGRACLIYSQVHPKLKVYHFAMQFM